MTRLVVQYTDSEGFGGAERVLLHLLAGLARDRWRTLLLYHSSPGIEPLVAEARELGVDVRAVLPMPRGTVGLARIPGMVTFLRRLRPAIFHAQLTWPLACTYGLVAATLARVRGTVATVHSFVELPYDRSARIQQRLIARQLGAYVAVSQHVAGRLQSVFGFSPGRVHVVRNGVPVPAASTPDPTLKMRLGVHSDQPVVLTSARLDAHKGIDHLIDAAAHVPRAHFVVAGDGPCRARFEELVSQRGLDGRFKFLGQRNDVQALLAIADVFVLPSLFEGLPLSVLEAMALARPTIATAVGGTVEVVQHAENGLLVPARDPLALSAAINRLLNEPQLAARLGSAARERVQRDFSVERMVRQIQDIYRGFVDDSGGG